MRVLAEDGFPFGSVELWQDIAGLLLGIAAICVLLAFVLLFLAFLASDLVSADKSKTSAKVKDEDRSTADAVAEIVNSRNQGEGFIPWLEADVQLLARYLAENRRRWRRATWITLPEASLAFAGLVCTAFFVVIELIALSDAKEAQHSWQYAGESLIVLLVMGAFSGLFFLEVEAGLRLQRAVVNRRAEWAAVAYWAKAVQLAGKLHTASPLERIDQRGQLARAIEQAARGTKEVYQKRLARYVSSERRARLLESGVARASSINDLAVHVLVADISDVGNAELMDKLVCELRQAICGQFRLAVDEQAPAVMAESHRTGPRVRLAGTGLVLTVAGLAYPHTPLGVGGSRFAESTFIIVGVISLLFGVLGASTATALVSAFKGVLPGTGEKD